MAIYEIKSQHYFMNGTLDLYSVATSVLDCISDSESTGNLNSSGNVSMVVACANYQRRIMNCSAVLSGSRESAEKSEKLKMLELTDGIECS